MSPSEPKRPRKLLAILSYVAAAMSGALGQFCFKMFSGQLATESGQALILSPYLWIAIVSYFSVMGLFILGLRLWGQLSTLYPIYGTTFVWALIIAVIWLGESVPITGIAGTGLILFGITLLNVKT